MKKDEKGQDNSAEALLARMRKGYKQNLNIKMGDLKVPCRIMPAEEQVKVISNAKMDLKVPEGHDRKLLEAIVVQKATLHHGCKVEGIPYLPMKLLNELSSDELVDLYDLYLAEVKLANPSFEALDVEQISEIIDAVKKKKAESTDYFTWQLAAIGRYCLDHLRQKASGVGL